MASYQLRYNWWTLKASSSSDEHEERGEGKAEPNQDQAPPDLGLVVLLLGEDDTQLGLEYQQQFIDWTDSTDWSNSPSRPLPG